jgi:thiol-disulfide isomerase/thioredoxin
MKLMFSRSCLRVAAFVLVLSLLACAPAWAQVNVGDKVDLNMTTIDGKAFNSQTLKGKMVLLDFWATWCGPCMQQVPHMVSVNEEFSKQGLQIIGISLDRSVGAMKPVIEQQKMSWAHVHDGDKKLSQQFAVQGIPQCFLIDPTGVVRWEGHPAGMTEELIAGLLKKFPPQLVDPKVVKAARETLKQVDAKLEAGDAKAALKLMARVPEDATKDDSFAKDSEPTRTKLETASKEMLKTADDDAAAGRYKEAAERLRELSLSLAGLPVGNDAKKKLADLMSKPEAKAAVEAAQKEAQAAAALEDAQKIRTAKKHDTAYPMFKQIAKAYAGTPSGDEAAGVVKEYEADAAFMKRLSDQQVGGKAKAALSVARSYAKTGKTAQARKKFEQVITDYPGTDYARTAQSEIAKLAK